MMKNLLYIFFILLLFSACESNLDPKPDNSYGDSDTWRLPGYAEGVLMNAYADIDNQVDGYGGNFLDAATDNAVTNNFSSGVYALGTGAFSPWTNTLGVWIKAYAQFRNIHLFLDNGLGDNVTYVLTDNKTDSLYKLRLKGEAYFLRAYWGFKLLQNYGGKTDDGQALGYPIVTSTVEKAVEPKMFKRNTYEECVAQISNDCDSAIKYLPENYTGNDPVIGQVHLGRASSLAASALKSRLYTYAASPAYQPNSITQITGMGEFTIVNNAEYTARWARAAEESFEAMTKAGNSNGLKANDFNAADTPDEFIWRSYHNNRSLETRNYPPLYYGNGVTNPSQNLVSSFPMKNGFPLNDSRSGYEEDHPYTNRDPRLNLTVLHNGSVLGGIPIETFEGGKDAANTHPNATRTGYYLRKWLSNSENMLNPESPQNDHHYHALFRKTELYLNFAEASNEAWGPNAAGPGFNKSAADIIKEIRNDAGITSNVYVNEVAAQGKDAFRTLIQNERRIALAFENHWFFDIRRWVLPLNTSVLGVIVQKDSAGDLDLTEFEVEKRKMNSIKYYYLPLPHDDVIKSQMKNNLGWN